MKVKVLFATLLIFISFMFCSCSSKIQDNTRDTGNVLSSPSIETSSTDDSGNVVASSNSEATPSVDSENKIESSPVSNDKIDNTTAESDQGLSPSDLKKYLDLPRSEYIKMLGTNYNPDDDYDSLTIPESHMTFPCLFLKDLGITSIFNTKEDGSKPIYIVVNNESNIKNINYKGAKPGMLFIDIEKKLTNGTKSKSWLGTEDDVIYQLEYQENGLNYYFVSYEESGEASELYISNTH